MHQRSQPRAGETALRENHRHRGDGERPREPQEL